MRSLLITLAAAAGGQPRPRCRTPRRSRSQRSKQAMRTIAKVSCTARRVGGVPALLAALLAAAGVCARPSAR